MDNNIVALNSSWWHVWDPILHVVRSDGDDDHDINVWSWWFDIYTVAVQGRPDKPDSLEPYIPPTWPEAAKTGWYAPLAMAIFTWLWYWWRNLVVGLRDFANYDRRSNVVNAKASPRRWFHGSSHVCQVSFMHSSFLVFKKTLLARSRRIKFTSDVWVQFFKIMF